MILSFQTDLARLGDTWSRLPGHFPDVANTSSVLRQRRLRVCFEEGGLHRQKAYRIKRLLGEVRRIGNKLSLDFLRSMNDEDAGGPHAPAWSILEGSPLRFTL